MIKRILLALTLLAAPASAQTYPTPTFGSVTTSKTGGTSGAINAWVPVFGVSDSSNGTPAVAGTGYVVGDVLTLADGCSTHAQLTVNSVTSGGVTGYNVTNRGACFTVPTNPVAVGSTSGTGTNATFTLTWAPLSAGLLSGSLTNNGGNFFIGGEQPNFISGLENVFVGDRSGGNITVGNFNVAVGHNACGIGAGTTLNVSSMTCLGTDAGRNIASGAGSSLLVGTSAAQNLSGTANAVVGNNAGSNLTSGTQNTILGPAAGGVITTGFGNVFVGYNSQASGSGVYNSVIIGGAGSGGQRGAAGGSESVIVGQQAGSTLLTGIGNNVVGSNAMQNVTSGVRNNVMGRNALQNATAQASWNVVVGDSAMQNYAGNNNNQSVANTAIGTASAVGGSGATFTGSTTIGAFSGNAQTSASNNTLLGINAGLLVTTGGTNTVVGANVGSTTLTTGSGNILIGTSSAVTTPAAATSNYLRVGTLIADMTAPTIGSGFGTSPSVSNGVSNAAFTVTVGTGGTATSGVVNFTNAAPHGWACDVTDSTTTSTTVFMTKSSPTSTTSVTFTNYSTAGVAAAWVAGDVLVAKCLAY